MSNLFYYFVEIYYLSATTATVRTMYTILNNNNNFHIWEWIIVFQISL